MKEMTEQVHIRLDKETKRLIRAYAKKNGMKMTQAIRTILANGVRELKQKIEDEKSNPDTE